LPTRDLPDIEPAVARVAAAIRGREPILVWGHEDLDGMTAAVCLQTTIRDLRGVVTSYIPAKGTRRHGLDPELLKGYFDQGIRLVITVDCGTTNTDEVDAIQRHGVHVVVTDHHEVLDRLPSARAVVNPKRRDSRYGFRQLAGVGVALKMAQALAESLAGVSPDEYFATRPELLVLTALGTIADRVPLLAENRILVRRGLDRLHLVDLPSVRAVLDAARVAGSDLTAGRFLVDLLPLFAAADGNVSKEMLLTRDLQAARNWASELVVQSQAWREQARAALELALRIVDATPGLVTVRSEDLSLRALGYCAARIKDEYMLPVAVIGRREDCWVGECRGVDGVNLVDLLKACGHRLLDFGGHAKACGFTVADEHVQSFTSEAQAYAAGHFVGQITETREPQADAAVQFVELAKDFKRLGPFGEGNPEPMLVARSVLLAPGGDDVRAPESPDIELRAGAVSITRPGRYDVLYSLDEKLTATLRAVAEPNDV
jgi:single-stranded-DNA-specific exonuclease